MDFSLKAVFGMDASGVKAEIKQLRREFGSFVEDYAKLGAGLAVGAFAALSKGAMDLAGRLMDTSLNIGVNIVSLQALEAQHGRNGVKEAELQKALEKTKAAVLDAAAGNDRARASLAALGLSADKLIKLPLDKQYEEIARATYKSKDETQAYSAVCELLGDKIGPKLFNSLRELGETGLPAVTKSAREAGHVMEAETIAALDRASDAIDDFKKRATVAVGNILVNFRTEEGILLMGMQLMKAAGMFGAGIVDAVFEAVQYYRAFSESVGMWVGARVQNGLVSAAEAFGSALNKVLPDRMQLNLGGLEKFRLATEEFGDILARSIAKTEPLNFRKTVAESWDAAIAKQKTVVDALNKVEFKSDAQALEKAGTVVAKEIKASGEAVAEGGRVAAAEIKKSAKELWDAAVAAGKALNVSRTGASYEQQGDESLRGARDRLRSQAQQMESDTSYASVWSPNAKNPMLYLIKSELAAVEAEIAKRAAVQNYAAKFGEAAARYQYGDTLTNRALQNLSLDTTRTASAVEGINSKLQKLMG